MWVLKDKGFWDSLYWMNSVCLHWRKSLKSNTSQQPSWEVCVISWKWKNKKNKIFCLKSLKKTLELTLKSNKMNSENIHFPKILNNSLIETNKEWFWLNLNNKSMLMSFQNSRIHSIIRLRPVKEHNSRRNTLLKMICNCKQ